MEAEIVTVEPEAPPTKLKKKGAISLKHKMIAELAARGYPVSIIAQQVAVKEATIYHLLRNDQDIWNEINKVLSAIFAEGDRMLANLRIKALDQLDEQLQSSDKDLRDKAIDKILKITDYGQEGNRTAIFNFPGSGGGEAGIQSVDDLILKMRKERGLAIPHIPQKTDKEEET